MHGHVRWDEESNAVICNLRGHFDLNDHLIALEALALNMLTLAECMDEHDESEGTQKILEHVSYAAGYLRGLSESRNA